LERLDYRDYDDIDNSQVRKRVQYLYKNMPEKVPEQEWFDKIIASLKIKSE
jgi:hypothetical protein